MTRGPSQFALGHHPPRPVPPPTPRRQTAYRAVDALTVRLIVAAGAAWVGYIVLALWDMVR